MKKQTVPEYTVQLREFRMEWITDNRILVFIGKRNTGKSVLLIDYLFYNQDIPFCTCISPTDDLNPTFRYHIPSRFIFDTYTPELIEGFVKRQQKIVKQMNNAKNGMGDIRYKNIDPRGILIMDDCLADSSLWKKDKNIQWIFMNGRHAKITLILTMQYQIGIGPELRVNIDYYFLCKETKRIEQEKLFRNYAGIFHTLDMFIQVHNVVTKDYGCLVIDNTSQSDKLEDQAFYYKATVRDPKSFRVCYDEFWENNNDYITGNGEGASQDNQNDDYQRYSTNRNKVKFNVGIIPNGS